MNYKIFDQSGPIDTAQKYASIAEDQQKQNAYEDAIQNFQKASEEYLKAKKQLANSGDQEVIDTLEMLGETYRRKSKLLQMRSEYGVSKIKENINQKINEKLKKKRNLMRGNEEQKQEKEQDKFQQRMNEKLKIINQYLFNEAIQMLQNIISYQNQKLESLENKFNEILINFKQQFNESTKEFVLSYGKSFVNVQQNPFAMDALNESINIKQIEKDNQKYSELLKAMSKLRNVISRRMNTLNEKLQVIISQEKSFDLNYGQLTLLAASNLGQQIGLQEIVDLDQFYQDSKRNNILQDLKESVINGRDEQLIIVQNQQDLNKKQKQYELIIMEQQKENDKLKKQIEDLKYQNKQLDEKAIKFKSYAYKNMNLAQMFEMKK